MIHAVRRADRDYLVVGVVRGVPGEVDPALEALREFGPDAVGLGIARGELDGLEEHFVDTPTEPIVPLAAMEAAEVRGLVQFGEVVVPNPAFVRVLAWGRARGVPVEALDQDDEAFVETFTDHIGYFELVRRTLRERRLSKRPPRAASPDEFVLTWERTRSPGRGSGRFAAAREATLADGARRIAPSARRVAVLVDRERFEGVEGRLASAAGAPAARVPG